MAQLSVVIPHWNGKHFLEACLDSLRAQAAPCEVILVDNASTDGSVEFLATQYPEVVVIRLDSNTGFDHAVNAGIQKANAPLICLLNNDTEVDPGWATAILQAANAHPEAGMFASKLLDFKDRTIIDSCGDAMSWNGRSWCIGELEKDGPKFSKNRLVFGAKAAASVYRAELFAKVGLFDETFFAYLEDVDMDFRAQLAGFKCLFVPDARVYHIGSATAGKGSAFAFRLVVRNHVWLILKNFPAARLFTAAPSLLYAELRFCAAAFRQRYAKAYFAGLLQSLPKLPEMLGKRWQIQKNRQVSLAYLDSIIERRYSYKTFAQALKPVHHGK